jgi:hypothetical protein
MFGAVGRQSRSSVRVCREEVRFPAQPEGLVALDRSLVALVRERGPLRAVLSRIACRLVLVRAWEPLGYARLSDYAVERLGHSARSVRSLAHVGEKLRVFPRLEQALVSGRLGWTKARLLASLPREEDEAAWIARAGRLTAEQLSKSVRAVDRSSLDVAAEGDEAAGRSRVCEVRCTPDVRWKWHAATRAASRAAGRMLPVGEAAELIAAEVLSAVPVDETLAREAGAGSSPSPACEAAGAPWTEPGEDADETPPSAAFGEGSGTDELAAPAGGPANPPERAYGALGSFLVGLEQADAFELDERYRRALALEQRLEARIGPLLARAWNGWVHRAMGYASREAYARERLGMDPTRARALVRLERAAVSSEPFARAYQSGALSWVKAGVLVPLVSADPLGRFVEEWVVWARQVTVRRLRDDVEWALALEETDPVAFRRTGGLPPGARGEPGIAEAATVASVSAGIRVRETRAPHSDPADVPLGPDREIGAPTTMADETCSVRFIAPAEVVAFFRAVLSTVRRRMERDVGRLPTEGQALGAMLDHVLSCWGVLDAKVAARHRVFHRDGWRCAVPGCTSLQNLHDHHIRFRSAGGSDAAHNRVTLCAFHHLRGVHAGRLRCTGRAPDGLTWRMGIRPGHVPLVTYRSGDLDVTRHRDASPTSSREPVVGEGRQPCYRSVCATLLPH